MFKEPQWRHSFIISSPYGCLNLIGANRGLYYLTRVLRVACLNGMIRHASRPPRKGVVFIASGLLGLLLLVIGIGFALLCTSLDVKQRTSGTILDTNALVEQNLNVPTPLTLQNGFNVQTLQTLTRPSVIIGVLSVLVISLLALILFYVIITHPKPAPVIEEEGVEFVQEEESPAWPTWKKVLLGIVVFYAVTLPPTIYYTRRRLNELRKFNVDLLLNEYYCKEHPHDKEAFEKELLKNQLEFRQRRMDREKRRAELKKMQEDLNKQITIELIMSRMSMYVDRDAEEELVTSHNGFKELFDIRNKQGKEAAREYLETLDKNDLSQIFDTLSDYVKNRIEEDDKINKQMIAEAIVDIVLDAQLLSDEDIRKSIANIHGFELFLGNCSRVVGYNEKDGPQKDVEFLLRYNTPVLREMLDSLNKYFQRVGKPKGKERVEECIRKVMARDLEQLKGLFENEKAHAVKEKTGSPPSPSNPKLQPGPPPPTDVPPPPNIPNPKQSPIKPENLHPGTLPPLPQTQYLK